jgi:hypothetical protein
VATDKVSCASRLVRENKTQKHYQKEGKQDQTPQRAKRQNKKPLARQ